MRYGFIAVLNFITNASSLRQVYFYFNIVTSIYKLFASFITGVFGLYNLYNLEQKMPLKITKQLIVFKKKKFFSKMYPKGNFSLVKI